MSTDTVETLLALESIKGVKARYCRSVDDKRWEDLRALFADGATFGGIGEGVDGAWSVGGPDEFVAFVALTLADTAVSVHHAFLPEVVLLDPDSAEGTWSFFDYIDRPQGAFKGYGVYHERYRREADRWLITDLRIRRLRLDRLPRPGADR